MKNNHGFTLVELLAVIVIIGVITGMSWPIITRLQEDAKMSKYETYGDSLVAAAKLYVDSYENDLFYYEEDLTADSQKKGQCAFISYQELAEHGLIKDFNQKGMTCASNNTFVIVKRTKGIYKYQFYLGCGNKTDLNASKILPTDKVYFILPASDTPYVSGSSGTPYSSFGCTAPVLK